MSNLLSIHNSKNQVGIGTNNISVSSSLTIKEDSKRYIVFNTGNDSIDTHRPIELEDETTLSTVKTNSISSPKLLYIASNSLISSLSFSSSKLAYLRMSNSGGLSLVDKTAPIVQSISATDGTYGFTSPNNIIDITVTFNETVTKTDPLSLTLSNNATASYNSGDNSTSIVFRYTIKQSDSDYSSLSVSSLSGTIQDLSGHSCTSISGTLGEVHVDTTAPSITTYNPVDEGTLSSNSSNITLTFNENVTVGTGNIELKQGGSTISTSFSCSGSTCTINPSSDLSNLGLTYNVEIDSTAIKDNAGNYFAGFSGTTYQINSKDTTAPSITSGPSVSSSNSDSTLATSSDTVTLTFTTSEPIDTPTILINGQTPSISNPSGNTWTATYSPQASHNDDLIPYNIVYQDPAGNSVSTGNVTSTVAHFETDNLRYYMWKQNHSAFSGSRGWKGYSWIQTQRHDIRTKTPENPATDKNNFLFYETNSTTDISGIVSGSSAGTVNVLFAGNWRDPQYHGRWGHVYDDNTSVVDEHIWQFEYKGNDTYGNYYHIINTQVQHNYNGSSWQGPNHQIGNCLGSSNAANNTSMKASSPPAPANSEEWYCYVNHVSGTKFTIKIYNNGNAPTHELYMYVSGNSYSYERMNWKYGSNYTVSSSDGENNMQNNFTIKFDITNLYRSGEVDPQNPYSITDIRYHLWEQNPSGETRGNVGYVRISVTGTLGGSSSKTFVMFTRDGNWTDYGQSSTDAGNTHTTAHGVVWTDNTTIPDEHVWKIVYNSGSGDTATYDVINSAQSNASYTYPELGNYCIDPSSVNWNVSNFGFKVNIIQNGAQWTMKRATQANGNTSFIGYSLAFWNPIHYYSGLSYGYVITLLGSGSSYHTTYTTTNFDFTFIT